MLLLLRNQAFIPTRSEVLPENTIIKSEHAPCLWETLRWQKVGIVVGRIKGFRHTSIHYEYLWPLLADYYYLLIWKSFVINFSFAAARCSHLLLCLPSPSGFSWKFPCRLSREAFSTSKSGQRLRLPLFDAGPRCLDASESGFLSRLPLICLIKFSSRVSGYTFMYLRQNASRCLVTMVIEWKFIGIFPNRWVRVWPSLFTGFLGFFSFLYNSRVIIYGKARNVVYNMSLTIWLLYIN